MPGQVRVADKVVRASSPEGAIQFALERGGGRDVEEADVDAAREELPVPGGSLNRKRLGEPGK